ncbi:MAG: hypothetical protein PHF25_06700 [Candidatus Margulisbacteria bacterium]|nr:hypothetical protein [Candidatus Margulisiibacteriota bacterium]
MSNHLVIHLTDKETLCLLINYENSILQTSITTQQNISTTLSALIKSSKEKIDRIIVIPETSTIKTTFISLNMGATDNFNESLINQLENHYISTKDTVIKYKIISETHDEKIEYLLAVLIIPLKLYKAISKKVSKIIPKKIIQWIPANYCLNLSIIDSEELRDAPLIIHVTETQTNIIIKTGKELKAISSLPFSTENLKLCLKEDGLSDNQINNKLNLKLAFDKELGFNTRLLINDTLSDLQKEIQFICSNHKLTINSCYIIANQLKHSDLATLISNKLSIPCQYTSLPEKTSTPDMTSPLLNKRLLIMANKALELVQNMQIFITYIPKKTFSENKSIVLTIMQKEIIKFALSLIAILCIGFYLNIQISADAEKAKTTLYGIKELVTATKSQYIDMSESLYKTKQLEKLQTEVAKREKENQTITIILQQIFQHLPNNIGLQNTSIQVKDQRILLNGKTNKEKNITAYIQLLSEHLPDQKILLKSIRPSEPIRFIIEVQL